MIDKDILRSYIKKWDEYFQIPNTRENIQQGNIDSYFLGRPLKVSNVKQYLEECSIDWISQQYNSIVNHMKNLDLKIVLLQEDILIMKGFETQEIEVDRMMQNSGLKKIDF